MIELGHILEGLVKRTTEGRLRWSQTARNDRYVTSVDAVSVAVEETEDQTSQGRGVITYRLDILDELGEIIESLTFRDTTAEQDELLARLYVLARRSARNLDSVLEKLAKGLEL